MADLYPAAIWGFGLIQLLGWMGGLLVRVSSRSRHRSVCHTLFFFALLLVGMATSAAFFFGTKCWLLSAVTLAGMILLAICDFDRQRRPVTI